MNEWISVKDRLPNHGDRVKFKWVRSTFVGEFIECKDGFLFQDEKEKKLITNVTHWMPLPGVPK